MRTKDIQIKIIEHLDEFEKENLDNDSLNFNDFLGFLNSQYNCDEIALRRLGGELEVNNKNMMDTAESEISRLIGLMYRYAKHYIKKALTDSQIQTAEEFSFLILLLTYNSLTKSELISKNILEKTSGVEVIKRLLNHGLIDQFDDPNDKRSQRVAITEQGKFALFNLLPKMHLVSEIIAGNLTTSEKNTLSFLLKKLDHHHHHIYSNDKASSLDDIYSKEII